MLGTLNLIELIIYLLAWLVIGGLPGFYLAAILNRNPRNLGWMGGGVAMLIGLVLAATRDEIGLDDIFAMTMLLWLVALVAAVILNVTKIGTGNYRETAGIQETTANLAYGLLTPTFVIVFMIVVFPMIWNVVLAFRPVRLRDLRDLEVFSLAGLTLSNFSTIFRNSDRFFDVFWPTMLTLVVLLAILLAGWLGGRFFARQTHRDETQWAWWGLGLAFLVALFIAGQRDFAGGYSSVITGRGFLNVLARTFIYTMAGTILAISMGLVAALVVKDSFPGRNIVRGFMLFPYIAPIVSVVFIWSLLLNAQFGLVNEAGVALGGTRTDYLSTPGTAFTMIILFQGWRYFPFAFLFILARIQAIPDDMYEAAKVDGAAPSQRLVYITLPQLRAVFGTLFILRFIWTFNKFDDVFLLTGGAANTQLVTIEIYDQLFARTNIGTASAVAMVLALVLFIVVGIYFRWFLVEEN